MILGYIVINHKLRPTQLSEWSRVLFDAPFSRKGVSVFEHYTTARRAIQRTEEYARDAGFNWDMSKWQILSVRPAPKLKPGRKRP